MSQSSNLSPSRMRRYVSFAASALRANLQDLPLPYRLFIQLTNACNCSCNMCGIWRKSPANELTTDEVLRVLRDGRDFVKWMDFSGGEIFLRQDVFDLLHYVGEQMPRMTMFHFATNGLLTRRIVEGARIIARSDISRFIVTVSLDGPEQLHDKIRGVPGTWRKCLETFGQLRREGVEVVFGMTLTEHNVGQYAETMKAVSRCLPAIGHKDFHVNLPQVSQLYYGNETDIDPPMTRLLDDVKTIRASRGMGVGPVDYLEGAFLKHAHHYLETGRSPMMCEALSSSAVMGPCGDVYPCVVFDRPIGNVRDAGYSIARLFRSRTRKQVRREILEGRCPHCWTPCEAYQAIIANTIPLGKNCRRRPLKFTRRS